LKLQSVLCARTRSHVWHMKVLLYAVFKVRGLAIRRRRSHRIRANGRSPMSGPSKLNSAVPRFDTPFRRSTSSLSRSRSLDRFAPSLLAIAENSYRIVFGRPSCEGRATDAEKHRARRSHPSLSHKRPGEPRASSIVCGRPLSVRRCDRARRDPTTCTP